MMLRWMLCAFLVAGAAGAAEVDSLEGLPLFRMGEGESVPFRLRSETTHVALYFSASWCPPCRVTTPPLVEEYARMLEKGGMPVEIVLVGADHSEGKVEDYMRKYGMRWPAVEWGTGGAVEEYASAGIPCLALVERGTGRLVARGEGVAGVEAVVERMRGLTGVGDGKPFRVRGWLRKYAPLLVVAAACVVVFFIRRARRRQESVDKAEDSSQEGRG